MLHPLLLISEGGSSRYVISDKVQLGPIKQLETMCFSMFSICDCVAQLCLLSIASLKFYVFEEKETNA